MGVRTQNAVTGIFWNDWWDVSVIDEHLCGIEVTDKGIVLPCPHYLLPHCLLYCQSVQGLNSHQVICSGF